MSSNSQIKHKILYIMKILKEKSNEENPLTVYDLIEELAHYGITAERKSIYSDIEILTSFGMDIICEKGRTNKYFVGTRDFELPELKLLVDAVQASKFITHKKSEVLIKKIERLTNVYEAKELQRQVIVADRAKTINESIYYNIDEIHKAIDKDNQIRFRYFDFNTDKEIIFRNEGDWYQVSPYALIWNEDNYYMQAHHPKYDDISNFRVDRMDKVEICDETRLKTNGFVDLEISDYSKIVFNNFLGETQKVKLLFDDTLVNVVIDKFGKTVGLQKQPDGKFIINVEIAVTPTFLGWVFMFGDKVKILEPIGVTEMFISHCQNALSIYIRESE